MITSNPLLLIFQSYTHYAVTTSSKAYKPISWTEGFLTQSHAEGIVFNHIDMIVSITGLSHVHKLLISVHTETEITHNNHRF